MKNDLKGLYRSHVNQPRFFFSNAANPYAVWGVVDIATQLEYMLDTCIKRIQLNIL